MERNEENGLMQRNDFDPVGCRFLDQWWKLNDPSEVISQSIRCYTPGDFLLLLKGTQFVVERWEVNEQEFLPIFKIA
jgi:hypothetical protein